MFWRCFTHTHKFSRRHCPTVFISPSPSIDFLFQMLPIFFEKMCAYEKVSLFLFCLGSFGQYSYSLPTRQLPLIWLSCILLGNSFVFLIRKKTKTTRVLSPFSVGPYFYFFVSSHLYSIIITVPKPSEES
jgi:hypothetical protein